MNQNYVKEIENRLRKVLETEKRRDGLGKIFLFVSFFSLLILLFVLIEAVGNFDVSTRTILFYVFLILSILLLTAILIRPILKDFLSYVKPDYFAAAKKVGDAFPEIKDELANSLQLLKEKSSGYSISLINAAFEHVFNKAASLNFTGIVDFSSVKKKGRIAFSVFIITASMILIFPALSSAGYRLIHFNERFVAAQKFIFQIMPGNKELTKGENVLIIIKTLGYTPGEVTLFTKSEEQTESSEKKLSVDSTGSFRYELSALKSSVDYYASSEGITSDEFKITVINRPIISSMDVNIIPPAYTRLPVINQRDNGNITALPGSKIKISVHSSRELSEAVISFTDSTNRKMNLSYSSASTEFTVKKSVHYQLLIKDRQNFSNANPITYNIKTEIDLPPSIELISPNENIKLGQDTRIPFHSKIEDDFGFSAMTLNYRLSASKYRNSTEEFTKLPITISKEKKEDEIYNVWNLSSLMLAEGETISYYLEIFDNDNVSGPKSAKTQVLTIQMPALDELFQSADNAQQNAAEELTKTFKEAEKLQQELKKISDDLKQNTKEISWQEKERIEKAAENFQKLGEKMEDISSKLAEMQKELAKNNLLSPETLEKYNELQKLMNEFNSEELKSAFKKLQDAMKGMMRDNVQMSLEEMKANEEMIKSSIERTMNLLKRIQIEQKVDELVKRTEDLSNKIDELKNKTDQSNLSDNQKRNELENNQRDIGDKLDRLNDEMKDLHDKMSSFKDMPKETLEKIQNEYDKQNNEKLSEEAMKALRQMQRQMASQNQQRLSSNMQSMKSQLSQLQNQMQQLNQMRTLFDMAKNLEDLLTISKEEEKLKNKTQQLNPLSPEQNKNAREQNQLQSDLSKVLQNLRALSQKTFAITPEMGKALGKAMSQMQQAQNFLQNQNSPNAVASQTEAMSSINEAATLMKGMMDQMMSGGQGSGMMGLMQQLQQLSQQQMSLNQLTQMLNQGQLSQEMMAQMQRLAQQQEMIRKSLEQLNQEARESGESKRIAANLENIVKEMKEVVTNLESQKVNDDLVKQQERILSRLLDAQRSMNERDFDKNRKSNSGQNTARTSPPDLILSTEEGRNKLRDELQKAIREGYKKDYEDLIRKYFEALEKEKK